MRDSGPAFRSRMWGTGDAEGTWNCGLCLLKSLEEDHIYVYSPPEAIGHVKDHGLTVPDDPSAAPEGDPINRSLLAAPSDVEISEKTPLELLIDPHVHPQFDPARTKQRAPMKMPDNRFAPNGTSLIVKYVCGGCSKPRTVKLSRTTVPVGAYMVRQHRRRKGRLDDTPPLPARGARRSKWNHKRWAADWRCRDCLSRIYGVAPDGSP